MRYILPVIVVAQFFCTSLWFAGNAIINGITKSLSLNPEYLAHLTSAIQFGFITGTLIFALLTIADRFSPSKVFLISAALAATSNFAITFSFLDSTSLLFFRFFTGFFLAGIYPVGMKIAADHFEAGLGKSLGFLVGALVLGTALPHVLKDLFNHFPWQYIIYSTSILAIVGGLLLFILVPDGPHRKASQRIQLNTFLQGFKNTQFRKVAFGYFGHMWELYTFWAFVPLMLTAYNQQHTNADLKVSLLSFLIIGVGAPACVLGSMLAQRFSEKRIAIFALAASGFCCLLSPLLLQINSPAVMLVFLFFWAAVVIADSPLFSTLIAKNATPQFRGTSLTIVNCIGFFITIVSIQFINALMQNVNAQYIYMFLAIGPALGLVALVRR